jgi:hypothetical protein
MNHQVKKKCFVCQTEINTIEFDYNVVTSLPVCRSCKGTEAEKTAEKEALESLGEGFVCGCI